MNHLNPIKSAGLLLALTLLLAACASAPKVDPRVTALQARLAELEAKPELVARGGEELRTARFAVQRATGPTRGLDDEEVDYRLYAADRLLTTAEMTARAKLAEDRRAELLREQERLVLEARTLEAERARRQADEARQRAAEAQASAELARQNAAAANLSAEQARALREQALAEAAEAQRLRDEARIAEELAQEEKRKAQTAAQSARSEAEQARLTAQAEAERAALAAQMAAEESEKARLARAEADAARAEMEALRNRLSELEAKQTERGLLITLGDVLFEFNKSDLKPGSARNLQPLADVLKERTEQTVIIEGHTDSIGSHSYNMTLSEKRAQSVADYLVSQGIARSRLTITGLGPDFPVADNGTAEGRQQNRRVEVILPNLQ